MSLSIAKQTVDFDVSYVASSSTDAWVSHLALQRRVKTKLTNFQRLHFLESARVSNCPFRYLMHEQMAVYCLEQDTTRVNR